jgi:glycolate oxidase FAD binding subunit
LTIVQPASVDEVCAVLREASRDRQRVWIQGGGTKLASAPAVQSSADLVLSTAKLNGIVAHRHGDLTATIQAGTTLADVNRALGERRQWIPLDPPWSDRATIGGIVATNDSGPRRHRYGAPRDLIIGVEIVRADGVRAKGGGIVVKNVAGYDIPRLMTGSFGTLAVIVSATFKLYPVPAASRTVVIDVTLARMGALVGALLESQLTPSAIELQVPPGRLLVRFETIEVAADRQAASVVALADRLGASSSVVDSDRERAVWTDHGRRPWDRQGAIIKITAMPAAVAGIVGWLAAHASGVDVAGRAGVGVMLAGVDGDVPTQSGLLADLRGLIPAGQGGAVVLRGSEDLRSRVDVWGPIGDGLATMRAIKRQFDPNGLLNPGRGPGGI